MSTAEPQVQPTIQMSEVPPKIALTFHEERKPEPTNALNGNSQSLCLEMIFSKATVDVHIAGPRTTLQQ